MEVACNYDLTTTQQIQPLILSTAPSTTILLNGVEGLLLAFLNLPNTIRSTSVKVVLREMRHFPEVVVDSILDFTSLIITVSQ